jgi:hypothetical protein
VPTGYVKPRLSSEELFYLMTPSELERCPNAYSPSRPLTASEKLGRIKLMPSNIEKLAEQINALTDYDPMALECTEATISQVPGERRIYLQSFMETAVFQIDFDQVLPYDPDGAEGTTSDVFAGARISGSGSI